MRGIPGLAVASVAMLAAPGVVGPARAQATKGAAPPSLTRIEPAGATIGATTRWTIRGVGLSKAEAASASPADLVRVGGAGVAVVAVEGRDEGVWDATVRVDADATPGYREVRINAAAGVSNLAVIRLDTLPQVVEAEPNDAPAAANAMRVEEAFCGVIGAKDVDHVRVRGAKGQVVSIEVEAQKLGAPVQPVLAILAPNGKPLREAREARGGDRDCRAAFAFPDDREYILQIRDNLYGGGDSASYRIRVTAAPFATSVFPLGGRAGEVITLEATGGTLAIPRSRAWTVPAEPGALVPAGEFAGPGGPARAAMSLLVGDGPEVVDDADRSAPPPPELPRPGLVGLADPERSLAPGTPGVGRILEPGTAIHARIGKPDEVDTHRYRLKKDDRLRLRIRAAELGSWLDSVIEVRNPAGAVVASNDDRDGPGQARNSNFFGVATGTTDSQVDFAAAEDGVYAVEVRDRYGEGGPEYAYRLDVGPIRPDLEVTYILGQSGDPGIAMMAGIRSRPATAGAGGMFNLKPGTSIAVPMLVVPRGYPGKVVLRAEGLPPGVSCAPVKLDFTYRGSPGSSPPRADPLAASVALALKVAADAPPGLGTLRVVATAQREGSPPFERTATLTMDLSKIAQTGQSVTRVVRELAIKVVATTATGSK